MLRAFAYTADTNNTSLQNIVTTMINPDTSKVQSQKGWISVSAIAHIATLYNERKLTDALDLIEGYGLIDEAALALFAIIGEVA